MTSTRTPLRPKGTSRAWVACLAWAIVGAAAGAGVLDLYVSRGAREYLQRAAEAELGRGAPVSMAQVMQENTRAGLGAAALWASLITALGCGTVLAGRRGHFSARHARPELDRARARD